MGYFVIYFYYFNAFLSFITTLIVFAPVYTCVVKSFKLINH